MLAILFSRAEIIEYHKLNHLYGKEMYFPKLLGPGSPLLSCQDLIRAFSLCHLSGAGITEDKKEHAKGQDLP